MSRRLYNSALAEVGQKICADPLIRSPVVSSSLPAHSMASSVNPGSIEIARLETDSPTAATAWDGFVAGQPAAAIAHAFAWGAVIQRAYGHRTYHLAAKSGDEIVGVLPLTEVRSRLFGTSLTSLPYHDVAGMLGNDPAVRAALLTAAVQLAGERRIRRMDIRSLGQPAYSGPVAQHKVTLILNLGDDEEALWKAIGSKPRNQVRKAEKSGLTAIRTGKEGLDDFYRVYAANMRDLGSPPHKPAWFRAIFDRFGGAAGCHLVQLEGATIGGLIALDQGDTVTVPWASSDRRYFKLCPNNLLYWETFRAAIQRGYTRFDFGRSSRGAGTYKFKRQWGATEVQLYWQELDATRIGPAEIAAQTAIPAAVDDSGDAAADGEPSPSATRALAVRVWQRLPVGMATWIGSRLRGGITL